MSFWMRAKRFEIVADEGQCDLIYFYGRIWDNTIEHCMRVPWKLLQGALAEREKVMAEQTAAMVEEIDALKDELRTLKETTTTV